MPPKAAPEDTKIGGDTELVAHRHRLMADLMVMAVACDQTRVFNMAYSAAQAATIKVGYEKPHHTTTHEEPVDEKLGYQPNASWFVRRAMESWAHYVKAFAGIKEGGTDIACCGPAVPKEAVARIMAERKARGLTPGAVNEDPAYGIGTTEYMRSQGGYAITLECGQHDDPAAPEVAYRAIRRTLAHLGLVDEADPPVKIGRAHV